MGAEYGSLPFDQAIEFFRDKVNLPTERWSDLVREGHDTAFTVAGATKVDLLEGFRQAVGKGLDEGTTLAEFQKDFDKLVEKHGWSYKGDRDWRTRVIFETNIRTAYAAGRHRQMSDPEMVKRRPYWQYRHGASVNPGKSTWPGTG